MNKKFSKIFALALALIMCMALSVPAFAVGTPASSEGSGQITINKNLIMNSDANVPAATFTFKLEAYNNGSTKGPLFNGIMNGVKANGATYNTSNGITVSFDGNEPTKDGLPSDANSVVTDGQKYATETFTIDFTGVTFSEPGVYRYVITENDVSSPYNISSANTQYIDVYVEYAAQEDGSFADTLSIQGVFMHNDDSDITDSSVTPSKSSGFDNMYTTYDLTVAMNVSGNQASKDEYFKFTVTITDCPVDDVYDVDIANAKSPDNTSTTLNVTGKQGSVDVYLQNGENFTVKGLPVGTKYTVTDETGTYTATYVVTENGSVKVSDGSGAVYENTDGIIGNTTVTFTNTRGGVIPTGILLTIAPFAALMLLGTSGAFVILKKKSVAA